MHTGRSIVVVVLFLMLCTHLCGTEEAWPCFGSYHRMSVLLLGYTGQGRVDALSFNWGIKFVEAKDGEGFFYKITFFCKINCRFSSQKQ